MEINRKLDKMRPGTDKGESSNLNLMSDNFTIFCRQKANVDLICKAFVQGSVENYQLS